MIRTVRRRLRVVCIVTALSRGEPGLRVPTDAKSFSLLQNVKTGSGAHPAS